MHLHSWDFGGQDIYHGTHALFLRSQALFILVWDRDTEAQSGYTENGLWYEHFPLTYWLEYIREASPASPVIVVENKCDDGRSGGVSVPVPGPALPFSAHTGYGRESLLGALRDICQQAVAQVGARTIGVGRWQVKQALFAYLAQDEPRAPADKQYRTLSMAQFTQLCDAQQGRVTSVPDLLHYFHHTGVVYYQEGLFHNQIILDQRWALEGIYSLFHRERTYRQLHARQGRFRRIDLEDLDWHERFTRNEQRLLLSFMESCALCFRLSGKAYDDTAVYIAPELLPTVDTVQAELGYRRQAGGQEVVYYTYTHPFLHQGVMRRFMVQLGRQFRDTALYWKTGVFLEPPGLETLAIITCARGVAGHPAWGRIQLEVRGPQRQRLLNWLRSTLERLVPTPADIAQAVSLDGDTWVTLADLAQTHRLGQVVAQDGTVLAAQAFLFLLAKDPTDTLDVHVPYPQEETTMPTPPPAVYLSYAWGDAHETGGSRADIVDQLYAALLADGYAVKRDTMDLGYKGLISAFMREIGRGDCIVVVISDKYLTSPFCMFELLEIYRHQEFYDRICPLVLADAKIRTFADRLTYVAHWKTELDRIQGLIEQIGLNVISASGSFQEYEKYRDITQHADRLLTHLADINTQTPQMLAANDFATLKQAIDTRLRHVAQRP